jgi:A/G-specific adenine glycosylase
MKPFSTRLLAWFDRHGRHDLPWQHPRTPYRVWVAEVMLQQTQVVTVIPYFERFIARVPDWQSLAAAPTDDVLALWAGLGYYARARNLQRAAQAIVAEHGGEVPDDLETLNALPGLGRSTAAAILAQAFDQRHAILDGNVKRVLARHAAVDGWPGEPAVTRRLWSEAEARLPQKRHADYTQAIMDLGATLCTARRPPCTQCPVADDCAAYARGAVERYPAPRPRRERPLRRSHVLIIEDASGAILFERRPPSGIWGGLWCLPLFDAAEDWRAGASRHYALELGSEAQTLPILRHSFSHFDLDLVPLRTRPAQAQPAVAEQAQQRWIKLQDDPLPGLPAPILKLLDLLQPFTLR